MNEDAFEWDDDKAAANWRTHGVAFHQAVKAFRDPFGVERIDDREDYGEERINLFGMCDGVILGYPVSPQGCGLMFGSLCATGEFDTVARRSPAANVYVGTDILARFIDAFVDELDLAAAGFVRVEPKATGRPGYGQTSLGMTMRSKWASLRRSMSSTRTHCAARPCRPFAVAAGRATASHAERQFMTRFPSSIRP